MSNTKKVNVKPINIDLDKPRKIIYDMNAFVALEEEFGTIDDAMKALTKNSIKAFRTFLWAGLLADAEDNGEELTVKQVGHFIDISNLQEFADKINSAVTSALPESDKKAGKN
jgi:hypothetical protein